jgi:dienelactone hydrolase
LATRSGGYTSSATFRAGDDGTLGLATAAPESGSYSGVDPDGIFWSMTTPDPSQLESPEIALTATADGGEQLATATLTRYWSSDGMTKTTVNDHGLVGVLVVPPGSGKRPAIITFGGSEGGLESGQRLAEYWASLGYVSLGLAYFGAPGLPKELAEIPLEYFGTALAWLKERPEVDPARLGVMGSSRGGELALLLGATYADLRAVVAVVPSGLAWPGLTSDMSLKAAWTQGGKDVAYVPPSGAQPSTTKLDGTAVYSTRPMFAADLAAAPSASTKAATIAVEKAQASILMLAADDDQMWPSCAFAKVAHDRLVAASHASTHADDFVCYPNAGHSITAPGLPTTYQDKIFVPDMNVWFALGGTPVGIAHAARDADTRIRRFLAQTLGS